MGDVGSTSIPAEASSEQAARAHGNGLQTPPGLLDTPAAETMSQREGQDDAAGEVRSAETVAEPERERHALRKLILAKTVPPQGVWRERRGV